MEQHFAPWPDTDPPIQWRKDLTTVFHTADHHPLFV